MVEHITYGHLYRLLSDLEFVVDPACQPCKVYRRGDSNTVIVLACRKRGEPARSADLVSVRRHLVDTGLIAEQDFEGFLSSGRLEEQA